MQSVTLTTAKCIIIHRLIMMCLPGCEIFLLAYLRDRCSGGITDIYIRVANEVGSEILKRVYGDTLELLLMAFEPATAGDNEAILKDHGN